MVKMFSVESLNAYVHERVLSLSEYQEAMVL